MVLLISIPFLMVLISVSDPDSFFTDPVPDPGKEKTFRKAIQKNLGVPTSMVLIYLYF